MNLELCPHCGGPAEHDSRAWNGRKVTDRENTGNAIYCASRECIGSPAFPTVFETLEEAATAWNTRADRDQLRARVSELEAMPKDHVIDQSAPLEAQLAQAEAWLVQMRNSYVQVQMTCNNMEQQRDAATEALKRARVAIEKAPHPSSCDGWRAVSGQTLIFRAKRCDCWKAAALHDLAAAETEK